MMNDRATAVGRRVTAMARREFPSAELQTALWLLRECRDDDERAGALMDADGDLAMLVLAVERRTGFSRPAVDRSG